MKIKKKGAMRLKQQTVYLDNAATTRIKPEVLEKMQPFLSEKYGNPSGVYSLAGESKEAIDEARGYIAELLNCMREEIYFTSGGSESDNWALRGVAFANREKGNHIITTKIEHHAILNTCKELEKQGFEISYVDVDASGRVLLSQLEQAIRPTTILISVMAANNEIGTIQPLREIGNIAKRYGILFHTDAVQAFGHIPIDVDECEISLLSASGHKLYAPKGIGLLYIREGVPVERMITGGGQERTMRAGTENVAGMVGLGEAARLAGKKLQQYDKKEEALRNYLIQRIFYEIPCVRLNGSRIKRLPNNAHFSFPYIDGEALIIMLDMKGVCASAGSACSASSQEASHVLRAIGLPEKMARSSLRLTLSDETTKEEIDYAVEQIKEIVGRLRMM